MYLQQGHDARDNGNDVKYDVVLRIAYKNQWCVMLENNIITKNNHKGIEKWSIK